MKKTKGKILLASVALLLGGVGAAALAGQQTQRDVQEQLGRTQKMLEDSGVATMTSEPFQGNVLGGTQVTTLNFLPEEQEPFVVKLVSRVYNGPFPQGKAFGAATVTTDVQFPADVQKTLDQAFGNQKIRIHTLVQFGGKSTTSFTVPAGNFNEDGSTLAWKAVSGTVRNLGKTLVTQGQWPGMEFKANQSSGGSASIGAARWNAQTEQAGDSFGNARGEFVIDRMSGQNKKETFSLNALKVMSELKSTSKLVSNTIQYDVGDLDMSGQKLNKLHVGITLKNLDRKALGDLSAQTRDPKTMDTEVVMKTVATLLRAEPVLKIDRVSVGSGKDELKLTGEIGIKPGKGEEIMTALGDPEVLMSMLRATAHFEGEQAALTRTVSLFSPGMGSEVLKEATANGMLKLQGTRATMDLDLGEQGLKLNGQQLF